MTRRLGHAVAVVGVLLAVSAFLGSAALASTAGAPTGSDSVLVGVQGPKANGAVAQITGDDVDWQLSDAGSYHSVERLPNGSILAAFAADGYEDCDPYPSPCTRTGLRIIDPGPADDPDPTVVWEWTYPVRTFGNSEVHDAELLPNGHYLVAGMEHERIFELAPNGTIVWEWRAEEHYDPPPDPTREDWLHINDVDRIGDGRYLVSVRNANQVVVVDRDDGVVEVINEDGDPSVMRGQHNPQWLDDGAVLVSDSSNNRVIELHRDDETGEWRVAWALQEAGGHRFTWPRDVDRLPNGNTLITDSRNHRVVEVTESGDVVATYRTPRLPYEADLLPHNEPVGGERYTSAGQDTVARGEGLWPVVGLLYVGLQHGLGLPWWVQQWHLATVLFSLGLVFLGVTLVVRDGGGPDWLVY